jgi:hypothetical protein
MDNQVYELKGGVTDILSKNNERVIFKVKTAVGKFYKVECPFFCPLSIGDGFYGVVKKLDVENVKVVKPPYVQIPVDKDNTMQFFIKALRGKSKKVGSVTASRFYSELEALAKEYHYGQSFASEGLIEASVQSLATQSPYNAIDPESKYSGDGVIAFLTENAADYCNNRNEKMIDVIAGKSLDKSQVRKLLDEWHNKRSMRRLYLLGLTRSEINNSCKNMEELYKICLENPYRVASIAYEKCERILNSVGKIASDIQKDCGRINRYVYDNADTKGWMCTPAKVLRRSLPSDWVS